MNYEQIIAEKDVVILQLSKENEWVLSKLESLKTAYESLKQDSDMKILDLQHQLNQFKRLIYGRTSERYVSDNNGQLNLFAHSEGVSSVETLQTVQTEEITYKRKKSNHKGRQLLNQCGHLEVEEIIVDVDDKAGLDHMGFIETRKLAIKSSKLYIKKYIRHRYINKITDEIKIADPIIEPIEKCEADISLLRHVTVSKFVDHQPEYRIQQMFKRHGVDIPSSTMNNWTHRIASLVQPVADHIKHQIINSSYMQMDESRIRVMSGKKQGTHQGYMWVMSSPAKKYIYFEYHPSRGREGPKEILSQFKGKFQSDGYSVYQKIEDRNENITHYECWAHVRRKFHESIPSDKKRAGHVLQQIQKLYEIERRCREANLDHEQRRQERSLAVGVLTSLKEWLEAEALVVTPKSPLGQAMEYALKRWNRLANYVNDGEIEIDNNLVENAIRPLALGRKNYLFAGSHDAASNIAVFYTLFGTCKAMQINPEKYMDWLLIKICTTKLSEVHTMTPQAYAAETENQGR